MKEPIAIAETEPIHLAIHELLERKISRLLVKNAEGKFSKIITEKDIGIFLLESEEEKDLRSIPVSEIAVPIISVNESTPIKDVAEIMIGKNIGSVAVSTINGIVGLVTKTDLLRHYLLHDVGFNRIGDIMTVEYSTINQDEPLYKVVSTMLSKKISRIILNDKENNLQGILTFRDLFGIALSQGTGSDVIDNRDPLISVIFPRKGFLSQEGFGGTTFAKDIMTKKIISVDYNDDVTTACTEMIDSNVNGLAVKVNGKISGIVSKTDVVRALSKID